ncbi:hypothetical protein LUZ60_013814 [Juncus effusus]|nr:hypothetical protein LUZ60_013814 [Juncus effusus]
MLRFGRRNLADKLTESELTGNESSDPDGSETKSVDDLEMAMGAKPEREHSSPVEETTGGKSSESEGLVTILVDKLETTIEGMFENNPSFWAENDVGIECPPLQLEESSLFQPLFRPQVIAVGPHHRKLSNTKQLENHKLSALQAVCGVDSVREKLFGVDNIVSLRDCLKLIDDMEEKARRCYERVVGLSREEFVQMLLLDSIFILTMIILELRGGVSEFDEEWVWETGHLFRDLILMENQIPFIILEEMWSAIKEKIAVDDDVKGLDVIGLFKRTMFWQEDLSLDFDTEEQRVDNLLGLYYLWNVPIGVRESTRHIPQLPRSWFGSCKGRSQRQGQDEGKIPAIPSAIDLYEAGLNFEEKDDEECKNMFDITFENGVLQIPTLEIDSENMSLIANLLCHENNNSYNESIVASYVYLMDSLINTKADIALLQKFGIVNNKLASDDQAAAFINSLGEHCSHSKYNNFYDPVIADVLDFTKPGWRRHWTSLKHTYFTSPWTGISLIAGIFLLFISCAQTYYAVFPRK